jgi:hypothetical protein
VGEGAVRGWLLPLVLGAAAYELVGGHFAGRLVAFVVRELARAAT